MIEIKQPTHGDWPKFGKVIEEYVSRVTLNEKLIWEEKLRLHIKPKPSWCPEKLWQKLVVMVVHQTSERK
jgi:hypothetical protein